MFLINQFMVKYSVEPIVLVFLEDIFAVILDIIHINYQNNLLGSFFIYCTIVKFVKKRSHLILYSPLFQGTQTRKYVGIFSRIMLLRQS